MTIYGTTVNSTVGVGIGLDAGAGRFSLASSLAVALGGAQGQTWYNNSSKTLSVAANVVNGGNTLTIGGSGKTVFSGSFSGSGGLIKNGAGLLVMGQSTPVTYTGTTMVNAGTLQLGTAASGGGGGPTPIFSRSTSASRPSAHDDHQSGVRRRRDERHAAQRRMIISGSGHTTGATALSLTGARGQLRHRG